VFKNFHICLSIFILLIFLGACEKNIKLEIPTSEDKMVVNALFYTDSLFEVHISKSQFILSDNTEAVAVENAQVKLYENRRFEELLTYYSNGTYTSTRIIPIQGNNYTIEIETTDLKTVRAVSYLPEKIDITNFEYKIELKNQLQLFACSVEFSDPPQQANYYLLSVFGAKKNESNFRKAIYIDTHDSIVAENEFISESFIFTDKLIDGKQKRLDFTFSSDVLENMEKYQIVLNSITSDLYLYLKTRERQISNIENPFIEPIEIHSNIQNGLGIFSGISPSIYTFELK